MRTAARRLWVGEVDVLHAEQRLIMFLVLWRADDAPDHIAVAQAETSYLRGRYIDIVAAREKSGGAQEAVSLAHALKGAAVEAVAEGFSLRLQDIVDQIVLAACRYRGHADLFRNLAQLCESLSRELVESKFGMLVAYLSSVVLL